ncbi:methyltransferase domain-containing protein [Cohnella sp. AR92]|uniref:methyltransferase domain-containing protein n=1 Tax=Cohnella sp. AR92 TaxID=648716 RepID=UPI000F8DBDDE|nr:methyltransferase domain-containing protein [Cohnella sp. AR92]RUS44220.1 methyltransferase domain-containing protein [Cohnella sp. AR92]
MLISKLCGEKDFLEPWFSRGCGELRESFRYHRKLWEWCYIFEALRERSMLYPFRRGLGFGVGKEPLTSVFASHGCEIVATDLDVAKAKEQGWVDTNQHALNVADLNEKGLCDPALMEQLVTYETVDMNRIPSRYHGKFDFTWSSCSFEHLGSIEKGKRFLLEQMKCLRSGGVAVHTTEYNLSSNEDTLEMEVLVIFRRKDIEEMVDSLRRDGYRVEIDYTAGNGQLESVVDIPPFHFNPHLRLQLGQYVSTSIGLIIQKP